MKLSWILVSHLLLLSNVVSGSIFGTITSTVTATLSRIIESDDAPEVTLDYGTFRGLNDALTGTENFLGIPFADAPRFDHATLMNTTLDGTQDATQYGPACPQHELGGLVSTATPELAGYIGVAEAALPPSVLAQSEDCLNINVQRPRNMPVDGKLPVLLWIHGGAYSDGAAAAFAAEETGTPGIFYQCAKIVQRSVEMGMPIMCASANHRLNAFGLSGGKEISEAGVANLAIEDQRLAMKWIQKYISEFGGNASRVTIMGESAGSWSVSTQMVANDGDTEDLFHGAIAMSGGVLKVDGQERAQPAFDAMVEIAGCSSESDKLSCLRAAPYEKIYQAVQEQPFALGYNSLALSWSPRRDGKLLKDSPHNLAKSCKIANVPLIIGDMKDEGTLFAILTQLNVTTDEAFKDYFKSIWWPSATDEQLDRIMELYPADPEQGSPFNTGNKNAISPQYKRLSALIGDYSFESQRRHLLDHIPDDQPTWSYQTETSLPILGQIPLVKKLGLANLPALGSFHVSDMLLYAFGTIPAPLSKNTRNIMGTIISFVNTFDPNNHGFNDIPEWPKYDKKSKDLYHFTETGPDIIPDTYRQEAMQFLNDNADSLGI